MAAISGCLSETKRNRKISKANRYIDNAIDNAKDGIEDYKGAMENILSELATNDNVVEVLEKVCEVKNQIEQQEETIKTLTWVKKYINEEVTVEESKK